MSKEEDDGNSDSGNEEEEEKKWFSAERAKTGRASCKRCKVKIEAGSLRIAKLIPNPFGAGLMNNWHHPKCFFESFQKAKATTRRLRCPEEEMEGWETIGEEDKQEIIALLGDQRVAPKDNIDGPVAAPGRRPPPSNPDHKDHAFREFRRLCADISNTPAYLEKTALVKSLLEKGTEGDGFKGDTYLLFRMLLPMAVKRVYNLHNKQLIKLFSKIFGASVDDMLEDLEQGDVSETIRVFFENSKKSPPCKKSKLTMQEVDEWLEDLSKLTREEDQIHHFNQIVKMSTSNDLKIIVRLIKHDLKTSAGPKHILEALHPDAYKAFQTSRDLDAVIKKALEGDTSEGASSSTGKSSKVKSETSLGIEIKLLTPVLPMLAEACRSVEYAMKKCPHGMISEIKYDGERVQVHKKGKDFKYFSRSLKAVLPHKVAHFKDYIPKAFPHGEDIILDSEVLLVDTESGKPLPFGTLGVHKKTAFKNASVCLFVFDCLYYNGKSLLNETIVERRSFLTNNMKEIPNHIMFSEMQVVHHPKDLEAMISKVLKQGLEGLVLKDLKSAYEPGKRHWLKVKKDYLKDGAMADSADLVVLGAWFGSGNKGGMMSIFLMGCWDPKIRKFCTVTKVHGGHDDKTLEKLQTELQMIKISKDQSKVPDWLICTKTMVPDFVSKDPKDSPVWEITGAEFTRHEVHTADGISVRFPRVSAIRSDKTWKEATSLPELQELYKKSKEFSDFTGLTEEKGDEEVDMEVKEEEKEDNIDEEGGANTDDDDIKKSPDSQSKSEKSTSGSHEDKVKENLKHRKRHRDGEEADVESKEYSSHKRHKHTEDVKTEKTSNNTNKRDKEKRKSQYSEDQDSKEEPLEEDQEIRKHKDKHDEMIVTSDNLSSDEKSEDKKSKERKKKLKKSQEESNSEEMSSGDNKKESSKSKPKKPLPNIFRGVKLVIPPEEKQNHELERYFVAFGGIVLDECESELATHIIYSNSKGDHQKRLKWAPDAKTVQLKWLLHSIKLKELQDITKYLVENHVHGNNH